MKKRQTTNKKSNKDQKKDKKQKEPKQYIPPFLIQDLREPTLITTPEDCDNENEATKNYSPDYKPEFIPCKIADEWKYLNDEEILSEFITIENDSPKSKDEQKKNQNDNKNKQNLKNEQKSQKSSEKNVLKNSQNKNQIKKDEKSKFGSSRINETFHTEDESDDEHNEVDPEIIEKLNNVLKYEDNNDRFIDPDDLLIKDNLPLYLVDILHNEIKWKRPKEYILHHYLWEKVKISFPKKKQSIICKEIIDTYKDYLLKIINGDIIEQDEEEKNLSEYLSNQSDAIKTRIFREYYPIIDKKYEIKICNFITREETDEEQEIRIKKENEKLLNSKDNKKIKKPDHKSKNNLITYEKLIIKDMKPNNLFLNTNSNFKNSFYTWMTSIFQFIFDNDIRDINTKKSILFNIYPQKDGVPIYNPKGKYIIKMYLMGKERKIIIDDTIPFSNDDEFIFPGTEIIEEIWPVLFTKALIKLNIYKYRHPNYFRKEEFTDISFIYNLTGKHIFVFDFLDNRVHSLLNKEYNENEIEFKKKYIIGFFKTTTTKSMKITQLYQSYDERITELNNRLIDKEKNKHLIPLIQSINSGINQKQKKKSKIKFKEDFPSRNTKKVLYNEDSKPNFTRRQKKFGTLYVNDPKTVTNSFKVHEEVLIEKGIVKNYLYSLNDFFENKNFNMRRTKVVNFDDIKAENDETKSEFKQLSLSEKKTYVLQRKELKQRHNEERIKRIDALSDENTEKYLLFKINSNSKNLPNDYQNFNLYNDSQISMARKCMANNWKFPPVEFFKFDKIPEIPKNLEKKDLKESENLELMKLKHLRKTILLYGWTIDNFKQICGENNLIEEKNIDQNKLIKTRNSADRLGIWFEEQSMKKFFDKIIVLFNDENLYKNNLLCDNGYYNYETDVYKPVEEYQAFYLTKPNNLENNNENNLSNEEENKNNIDLIFQPYIEQLYKQIQPKVYLMPYINIDVYDCNTQSKIFSKITLNQFYSTFHSNLIVNDNGYYIIITGGYYSMGYTFNVLSNGYNIKNMTKNNFYQQILNYKTQEFKIDFPSLEKNKLWLFGKILITNTTQNLSTIRFKLNIYYPIKQILPFIHVYLENNDINIKRREIMLDEFITLEQNNNEDLKSKDYVTIFIKPEYLLKSSNINIEILYDNENYKFELFDNVNPYEISGTSSEKHNNGLIFSEYIYPSEDEIVSFIDISVREMINNEEKLLNNGEVDLKLELYQLIIEPNINFQKESIHFSYSDVGNLIKSWTFYDDINITNIVFYGKKATPHEENNDNEQQSSSHRQVKCTKSSKKLNKNKKEDSFYLPYVLICYTNDQLNNKINFDNIKWKIRIFSDNIISFVKNNSKVSHENKVKQEWEDNQPGRKLLANVSRTKFLIYNKKLQGKALTQEEFNILNKERLRIYDNENNKEEKAEKGEKNNKKMKLNKVKLNNMKSKKNITKINLQKNASMDNINENNNEMMYTKINKLPIIHSKHFLDTTQFKMQNILDNSTNNNQKLCHSRSSYIIKYSNYINQPRTVHLEGIHNLSVLNPETLNEYNKQIIKNFDEGEKIRKNEGYFVKNDGKKEDEDDKKFNKFLDKFGKVRIRASNSMKDLLNIRNGVNKGLIEKINCEKKVKQLIQNYNNGTANMDVNEMINAYENGKRLIGNEINLLEELSNIIEKRKIEIVEEEKKKTTKGKKKKN